MGKKINVFPVPHHLDAPSIDIFSMYFKIIHTLATQTINFSNLLQKFIRSGRGCFILVTSLSLSLSLICWAMNWTPCIAFSTWAYLLKMHPPPNKSTENWSKPPNESECEKWNYSSGQKRDLWAEMLLAYWFKFCNKNYIKIIIIKLKKYIINKNI